MPTYTAPGLVHLTPGETPTSEQILGWIHSDMEWLRTNEFDETLKEATLNQLNQIRNMMLREAGRSRAGGLWSNVKLYATRLLGPGDAYQKYRELMRKYRLSTAEINEQDQVLSDLASRFSQYGS